MKHPRAGLRPRLRDGRQRSRASGIADTGDTIDENSPRHRGGDRDFNLRAFGLAHREGAEMTKIPNTMVEFLVDNLENVGLEVTMQEGATALAAAGVEYLIAALTAIRDVEIPDVPDADFQRRAREDLQEIARAALIRATGATP